MLYVTHRQEAKQSGKLLVRKVAYSLQTASYHPNVQTAPELSIIQAKSDMQTTLLRF